MYCHGVATSFKIFCLCLNFTPDWQSWLLPSRPRLREQLPRKDPCTVTAGAGGGAWILLAEDAQWTSNPVLPHTPAQASQGHAAEGQGAEPHVCTAKNSSRDLAVLCNWGRQTLWQSPCDCYPARDGNAIFQPL